MWKPEVGGEKWFCGDCGSQIFGNNPSHADPIRASAPIAGKTVRASAPVRSQRSASSFARLIFAASTAFAPAFTISADRRSRWNIGARIALYSRSIVIADRREPPTTIRSGCKKS